jgi:hypothetical protein
MPMGIAIESRYGQSGDVVEILMIDGRPVVKKSSLANPKRLIAQAEKQGSFGSFPNINIPRILERHDNGTFTMEYVPGMALGEFLTFASHKELSQVLEVLEGYFVTLFNESQFTKSPLGENSGFLRKIDQFMSNERLAQTDKSLPGKNGIYFQATRKLMSFCTFFKYVSGPNHGDFSFDNILVSKRGPQFWLIDMLDSPFETPMIDVGRMLLDADSGWWWSGIHPSGSELISHRAISDLIRRICSRYGVSNDEINAFKVFAALRILPYSENSARVAIINTVLTEFVRTKE